jgi:hypothetical protein
MIQRTRMNFLALIEIGIILLFVISALVAMTTQTPLLQNRSLGIDRRIFPITLDEKRSAFDLPPELGSVRIEPAPQYGCLQLVTRSGQSIRRVCNQHLLCLDRSATMPSAMAFEVFRFPQPNAFYVETGSQCNSACCDWRGMSFTGEGERLDDDILRRLTLRLGVSGIIALTVGLLCLIWAVRSRVVLSVRLGIIGGFGVAVARLWWNL